MHTGHSTCSQHRFSALERAGQCPLLCLCLLVSLCMCVFLCAYVCLCVCTCMSRQVSCVKAHALVCTFLFFGRCASLCLCTFALCVCVCMCVCGTVATDIYNLNHLTMFERNPLTQHLAYHLPTVARCV